MKHEPRKVYVIEKENYKELTYQEFCKYRKSDISYENRYFIPIQGMLLEVDKKDYTEFYRDKERIRYLKKLDIENSLCSIDALDNENHNGIEFISDASDIAEEVVDRLMLDKLRECLFLLSEEEQELIHRHYYDEMPEVELGRLYGITQQAVSKRLKKIREKIKSLMEQ